MRPPAVSILVLLWAASAQAQVSLPNVEPNADAKSQDNRTPTNPQDLDTIRVIGASHPLSQFPGAVSTIRGDALRHGQRQVNLSESLQRVPGVSVFDRRNYAQDLQIQSRGFGARSTFGIRGLRLIVDGVPASAADGQGQAASFPLSSLDRIDVLRGPLALQYGNASGGAIVGSSDLTAAPSENADVWAGSDDSARLALRADGRNDSETLRWRLLGSRFTTGGFRPQSAAERSQFNLIGEWMPNADDRFRVVVNALSQPRSQDPLGLTRGALRDYFDGDDSAAADPLALQFDTRKRISDRQLGLRWERRTPQGGDAWIGGYLGERSIEQYLAIPIAAQRAPSNSGGVIDLERSTIGVDAGYRWSFECGSFSLGTEAQRLRETRRGYENFVGNALGIRGRLRRDERNRVGAWDVYAVGDFRPADDWTLLAGLRHSRVSFESQDRYNVAGNSDDSGRSERNETAFSFGVARSFAWGEAFASAGRGFETPTVNETAYRPDGASGFNRELRPAHSRSAELGLRWRNDRVDGSLAIYRIDSRDDIVPAISRGGRASFANAGKTRRQGIEFGVSGRLSAQWRYTIAANWIDAEFSRSFGFRVATPTQTLLRNVSAGNRIPGIPRADAFAELEWRSREAHWSSALEMRAVGKIYVDDLGSDTASGYARFSWRLSWQPKAAPHWSGYARIDNLFDRRYAGSVIVNEANGRFFEPAAGREFTIGLRWRSDP